MFGILIIGLIGGTVNVLFLMHDLENGQREWSARYSKYNFKNWRAISLFYMWPMLLSDLAHSYKTLIKDTLITGFIVGTFSLSGMIGGLVAMSLSGLVSGWLWFREVQEKKRLATSLA